MRGFSFRVIFRAAPHYIPTASTSSISLIVSMTTLLGMRRAAVCTVHSLRTFSTSVIRRRIEENITGDRLAQLLQEQGTKPLLVDFVAEWCGPCKMLSPMLHKLASTPSLVGGKELDLVTIDVDQQMEAAQKYGVRFSHSPPTPTPFS